MVTDVVLKLAHRVPSELAGVAAVEPLSEGIGQLKDEIENEPAALEK